jgi:hypothetical protein
MQRGNSMGKANRPGSGGGAAARRATVVAAGAGVALLAAAAGGAASAETPPTATAAPAYPLAPEFDPRSVDAPKCLGIMPDGSGVLLFLTEFSDSDLTISHIVAFKMAPGKKAPFGATVVEGRLGSAPDFGAEGAGLDPADAPPWEDADALLEKRAAKINAGMRKAGLLRCDGAVSGTIFRVTAGGVDIVVQDTGTAVMVTPAPGAAPVRVRGLSKDDSAAYDEAFELPREHVSGVFFHPAFPHLFVVIALEWPGIYSEHRGVLVVTPEKLRAKAAAKAAK